MSDRGGDPAGTKGRRIGTAAVVLAGGFGTRIGHLLGGLPKPMMPVAGRPFLEWVARFLAGQGVRELVFSTGYRAETIERHFAANPVSGCTIACVREEDPLGTAGGFLHAVAQSGLDRPSWLVANGDSLALAGIGGLIDALQSGAEGAILGIEAADASRFGTLVADTEGRLVRFSEKNPGAGVVNAGVYALSRGCLSRFPEKRPLSFESESFPSLLAGGCEIRVIACQAPFLDIGTEESLRQADAFISAHADWFQT